MSYKKPRWRGHGLQIDDSILARDWDLVPAIVIMHDAAVDLWEEWWKDWHAMDPEKRPPALPPLYFNAIDAAGLAPLARRISEIQRERSERPSIPDIVMANALNAQGLEK